MKMKKLFVTTISVAFAMLMMVSNVNAQKKFVNKAQIWAENGENLDTALKAIQFAETQEKTKDWGKTYYVKGLVYSQIAKSEDPKIKEICEYPLVKAFESYKKAYDMEGSGGYKAAIDIQFLTLANSFIQSAIDSYNEKDYQNSYLFFAKSLEVKEMPVFKSEIDTAIIFNTAVAAQRIEKYDEAIKYYDKLIEYNYGQGDTYSLLAECYKAKGESEKYVSTLKTGFEKYPANQALLGGIINYYLLEAENPEEAFKYLEVARTNDPNNPQFFSAEAHLYNKLGDLDKAKEKYKTAIEMNPNLFEAQYNIGVIYFNEGVELSDEANLISDNKKYEVAKQKADDKFKESLPYIEKAFELSPDDVMIMQTLKTLYYRLQMNEKYDEINKLME